MKYSPQNCKKTAYITLVRSIMDYGGIIWNPYLKTDVDRLERIQHQVARFITGDYKTREPGCITKLLIDLQLPTLEKRRTAQRLIFMFKVVEGLVPAISPSDFVTKTRHKKINKIQTILVLQYKTPIGAMFTLHVLILCFIFIIFLLFTIYCFPFFFNF
jgi:hypothetical protein